MRFFSILSVCLFYTVLAANMRAEESAVATGFWRRVVDGFLNLFRKKPQVASTTNDIPAPVPSRGIEIIPDYPAPLPPSMVAKVDNGIPATKTLANDVPVKKPSKGIEILPDDPAPLPPSMSKSG